MENLKKELREKQINQGIIESVYCSTEEEKEFQKYIKEGGSIPDDVYLDECNTFFRYKKVALTENEISELLLYRQLEYQENQTRYLKIIKNTAVVFAGAIIALTIIIFYKLIIAYYFMY